MYQYFRYVRIDPATGGERGCKYTGNLPLCVIGTYYVTFFDRLLMIADTLFDVGAIADLVQVKNALWHQFGGQNQTRYKDAGSSTRLSDAFETTVAGAGPIMLQGGDTNDVALPYLKGYGPDAAFTEDTGTLFGLCGGQRHAGRCHIGFGDEKADLGE